MDLKRILRISQVNYNTWTSSHQVPQ